MVDTEFLKDDEKSLRRYRTAKYFIKKGDFVDALDILEELISDRKEKKDTWKLHLNQGSVFTELARITENPYLKFAYKLASAECYAQNFRLSEKSACSLHSLATQLGSVLYYKDTVEKAKQALGLVTYPLLSLGDQESREAKSQDLEMLIRDAEYNIFLSERSCIKKLQPLVWESKKSPEPVKDDDFEGLKSYWARLDVNIKRDIMKVSIEKLKSFVKEKHVSNVGVTLESILTSAKEDRKWTGWMCRASCSEEFSVAEECKKHFEQEHAADIKPSLENDRVKRIGKDWSRKIAVGGWEPLDVVAAVDMINYQTPLVKEFTSKSKKNGWSKEWPLAVDEERGQLLKEIKSLLVSLCGHNILSSSIRLWLMRFPLEHLRRLEVSEQSLSDSRLMETPQSICFLECLDLIKIQSLLTTIKCERHDGTDLISRAVESLWGGTRVKEKIDFDPQFSFLLLDKRLLKSNNAPFDDEGTVNVFEPDTHYAKAHAQGDDIISWLVDKSSVDKSSPRPIKEQNLGIWMAVLKAVQFTCRALEDKYEKKELVSKYDAALTAIKDLCKSEVERRINLQEDQWKRYASLLRGRCEDSLLDYSRTTRIFLYAVKNVLEGTPRPTFDFPTEESMNVIREHESIKDDMVLMSIDYLKLVITRKVLRIDSKILLIDNSRIRLLSDLTRLSFFDSRSYLLQLLKPFLLSEIEYMESKAKSEAAEADLLLEVEKMSQAEKKSHAEKKSQPEKKKKKKNRSIKKSSTSMNSPLDKTVEIKPSVNVEPEDTSPSLKTVEEDLMEPEDTLASEMDRLEISSNTDHQEEATKVDHGEDSLSEDLESSQGGAYNSPLDMTLKALMNINVLKEVLKQNEKPFQDNLEEQVPFGLQNLFTAVVSEQIKTEGVYILLLRDFLASLEQALNLPMVRDKLLSMSSDAAGVLVTILEFWHCWENSERESLVTRLFTLDEYERMSCKKCRIKPNYSEQSSYGIVVAADSVRDLKCAFGNIKFVDILKMIRMEYKMLCDIKTGGCGETNFVHHVISRFPPIFTIVLEWDKSETEKEISETTKALEVEIDISRLYKGLEPNTKYRLVSIVGCGEEKECICLAYEKKRWVNLRRDSLAGEDVGKWKSVVRFCGERKVRPEILFYEAVLPVES